MTGRCSIAMFDYQSSWIGTPYNIWKLQYNPPRSYQGAPLDGKSMAKRGLFALALPHL